MDKTHRGLRIGGKALRVLFLIICLIVTIAAGIYLWIRIHHSDHGEVGDPVIPHIEKVLLQTTSVTDDDAELSAKVLLHNNLPFIVHAKDFKYQISLNDIPIVVSHPNEELILPSDSSKWTTLKMTINKSEYDSIVAVANKRQLDTVDYHFDVSAKMSWGTFNKTIHYDDSKRGALFRLPATFIERTKVKGIDMEKGKLKTDLNLYIKVINYNSFPIKVKDVSFMLLYSNTEFKQDTKADTIRGDFPGKLTVAPKDTFSLVSPEKLPLGATLGLFLKLITNPQKIFYKLDVKFKVDDPDNDVLNDANITIRRTGTLDALTEAPPPKKIKGN